MAKEKTILFSSLSSSPFFLILLIAWSKKLRDSVKN